jgi:hypothetical protein
MPRSAPAYVLPMVRKAPVCQCVRKLLQQFVVTCGMEFCCQLLVHHLHSISSQCPCALTKVAASSAIHKHRPDRTTVLRKEPPVPPDGCLPLQYDQASRHALQRYGPVQRQVTYVSPQASVQRQVAYLSPQPLRQMMELQPWSRPLAKWSQPEANQKVYVWGV